MIGFLSMSGYLDTLFSLTGRTALVTGGSSGIGYAIAEALGRAGADLVIAARRPEPLAAAVTRLRAHGVNATAISADLADRTDLTRLCRDAATHHGDIDILVNDAANNIRRPMAELTTDDYEQTMAVNITAPYLLGQHYGPRMAARGWGRIINIGSQQSIRAFGDSGAYGIAKAALTGLTRSQAEAWSRHGVTSNTIIPGFVLTPLTQPVQAVPGRVEALAARSMTGRNGLPTDFAGLAVLLAGPAGAYITGQALCVDGGFSVH
ncbi:2-deoxy-D-gluconate 3-dehydrogenase [Planomonospora parontospora subsp. parontospora]|uniref:2-deoxy-D-gluconate 3-dehydrogenase n=2 Tax=Planomonospora parontospora TaxID=58119 RepID=A0AA37BIN6_9ACTN|nr:SDR family oxidoreductase [Planomonospora parontospora]GGK77381.1 2-deoxy-D-gluconate 3-dehydrogenase [Planomonospora parontospora]GII10010.1 2-deoxy-D-gluconate 3-dehydrogenase [Planomonospora parontospora subsp. parontospora]